MVIGYSCLFFQPSGTWDGGHDAEGVNFGTVNIAYRWLFSSDTMNMASGRDGTILPVGQDSYLLDKRLCKRCHTYFRVNDVSNVCRYHPATYVCRYHPEGEKYYAAVETNEAHKGWHGRCW